MSQEINAKLSRTDYINRYLLFKCDLNVISFVFYKHLITPKMC